MTIALSRAAPAGALEAPADTARRAAALADWRAAHDPKACHDTAALGEAAALAPLVDEAGRLAFEPSSFGELVAFIEALPF